MAETNTSEMSTLTLANVSYDEKYRLNQGSASQLVRGLTEMVVRLTDPTNDYQRELYPALRSIVSEFVERYEQLLTTSNQTEFEIHRYNLHGYSGRVKMPISTRGVKYNLIYKYANFGDYLKTIVQRLKFLTERQVPQRYITNEAELAVFTALQTKVTDFLKFITEETEPKWNTAVATARTAGGESVQVNLRRRTEQYRPRVVLRQQLPVPQNKYQRDSRYLQTGSARQTSPAHRGRNYKNHNGRGGQVYKPVHAHQ